MPPSEPYRPDPDQMQHKPDISGNAINGLGEGERRRPTPIYWRDPSTIAHGPMQTWMIELFQSYKPLLDVYREGDRGPKTLPEAADEAPDKSAEEWTAEMKAFARENEADLVGVADFDPLWAYDDREQPLPKIVVMGAAMDWDRLRQLPPTDDNLESPLEVAEAYNQCSRNSKALAAWIREQGYQARAYAGPWAGDMIMIPAALAAGFGELGKHGSIINREYGSSFRLSTVATDMPLVADRPDSFGAEDFCLSCHLCTNECPPEAIFEDKQLVRGDRKWYVDFDRCVPYFNETQGCGICIAVCPWSRPGIAPKLAEKMTRRRSSR